MTGAGLNLTSLRIGQRIAGLSPQGPVQLTHVEIFGSTAVTVTYREADGSLHEEILYADDLTRLRLLPATDRSLFDADPELFKVTTEALRISMGAQFDPMLAVLTSDVEPLPHQIQAVYGEMLPRTPLRFLLADDPGAGKTIMAGRMVGARLFFVTRTEVRRARNVGARFRLAMVAVSPDGPAYDEVRYLPDPLPGSPSASSSTSASCRPGQRSGPTLVSRDEHRAASISLQFPTAASGGA